MSNEDFILNYSLQDTYFQEKPNTLYSIQEPLHSKVKSKTKNPDTDRLISDHIFKFPVFPLINRHPTRLYAVALESAKQIGMRDSYSLFTRNPSVKKLWATEKERYWLADHEILAQSIKYREIAIAEVSDLAGVFGLGIVKPGTTMEHLSKAIREGIRLSDKELKRMKDLKYWDGKSEGDMELTLNENESSSFSENETKNTLHKSSHSAVHQEQSEESTAVVEEPIDEEDIYLEEEYPFEEELEPKDFGLEATQTAPPFPSKVEDFTAIFNEAFDAYNKHVYEFRKTRQDFSLSTDPNFKFFAAQPLGGVEKSRVICSDGLKLKGKYPLALINNQYQEFNVCNNYT